MANQRSSKAREIVTPDDATTRRPPLTFGTFLPPQLQSIVDLGHIAAECWENDQEKPDAQGFKGAKRIRRKRKEGPRKPEQGWVDTGRITQNEENSHESKLEEPTTLISEQPRIALGTSFEGLTTGNSYAILQEVDTGQLEDRGRTFSPK
ncbi:hypothetical protein HAX54_007882 [Datura stramonium]|uniref:Uncharacterized protein n=1 Tax=Datura stramonium TaxID=4076 RepID=A0ABS8WZK9_DATST|nr:hypothetical protein [Datura stramonium]